MVAKKEKKKKIVKKMQMKLCRNLQAQLHIRFSGVTRNTFRFSENRRACVGMCARARRLNCKKKKKKKLSRFD